MERGEGRRVCGVDYRYVVVGRFGWWGGGDEGGV